MGYGTHVYNYPGYQMFLKENALPDMLAAAADDYVYEHNGEDESEDD